MKRKNCKYLLIAVTLFIFGSGFLFSACGGGEKGSAPPQNLAQPSLRVGAESVSLSSIIAELQALQKPSNVDEKLFEELKFTLVKALESRYGKKITSRPPTGPANAINDLEAIDIDGTLHLTWSYVNVGDYNQSGKVEIQDIFSLADHFLHKRDESGSWNDPLDEVIDGDGSGKIDIGDVFPLADNFFNQVSAYLIFASQDGESFADTEIASVPFSSATATLGRLRFTIQRPEGEYYYVKLAPVDSANNQGEASNVSPDIPMPTPRQGYVGANTCLTCHPNKDTWFDTAHRQSQREPNEGAGVLPSAQWSGTINITDAGTGISFDVELSRSGEDYLATFGGKTYKVIRTYGGGFGYKQRFITRVKHSELILPFQWNELANGGQGAWAPYDVTNWFNTDSTPLPEPNMSANFAKDCMGCHSTGYTIAYSPYYGEWVGAYNDINTSCERCHGPGQAHVSAGGGKDTILNPGNPADGTYEERMRVCGSCHTRGVSIDLIGDEPTEYPWSLTEGGWTPFADLAPMFDPVDYTSSAFWALTNGFSYVKKHRQQYLDFLQSAHYASGMVACWTCHNVHEPEPQIDPIQSLTEDEAKTRCIGCHSDKNTQAHYKHAGNGPNTWCASCHMVPTGKSAVSWDNRSHVFVPIPPQESINLLDAGKPAVLNSCNNIVNGVACHGGASALTDRDALVAKQADYDAWFGGG